MSYITVEMLARRISQENVNRITDDNGDGSPDSDVIDQLLQDSRSYIDEGIESIFSDIGQWPLEEPIPASVIRLQLDAAEAYAAKRFHCVRGDWEKMFRHVDVQIDRLRSYMRSLGVDQNVAADPGIALYTSTKRGW